MNSNDNHQYPQDSTSSLKIQLKSKFNIRLQKINYTPVSYVNNKTLSVQVHDVISIMFSLPMNQYSQSNKVKVIILSRLPLISLNYISSYYVQLTYFNSPKTYIKFHLRNYYDHNLCKHTSLRLSNETLYISPMKYHDVSIENTYYYQLSLIVTQSIENI